ncbi:hypothetical protein [Nocardiopsis sp. NRRL B-16309]|nr:hypothetical protein [Nocardiopsis sp. NRRL B-16309]
MRPPGATAATVTAPRATGGLEPFAESPRERDASPREHDTGAA